MGEGAIQMIICLQKSNLVKVSTKRRGVKNLENISSWFVYGPKKLLPPPTIHITVGVHILELKQFGFLFIINSLMWHLSWFSSYLIVTLSTKLGHANLGMLMKIDNKVVQSKVEQYFTK